METAARVHHHRAMTGNLRRFKVSSSSSSSFHHSSEPWLGLASRLLTLKNVLIGFLTCFVLVSVLFPAEPVGYIVYQRISNGSVRILSTSDETRTPIARNWTRVQIQIFNRTEQPALQPARPPKQQRTEVEFFESEAAAIKESIKKAFMAVNRQIDYCPLLPSTLQGPLDVNALLRMLRLDGLVQFHDPGTFNLTSNTYNDNELKFLAERELEANKNDQRFRTFWEIWHTNDMGLLNWTVDNGVELGGRWKPRECLSRSNVAIIIPYRDRLPHLMVLVNYLHVFLWRQLVAYRIFVVEPTTPLEVKFNKGRVMNSAFLEALKIDPSFNCVIFHDVDLIPEDDRNLYTCSERPKHLSVGIDKFDYRLPYDYLVGGVFSIKPAQYREINGYSNSYWGWGGEDDDFATRIKSSNYRINRPPTKVARYKMMRHKLQKLNEDRHNLLRKTVAKQKNDGLNSVQYQVVQKKLFTGFTYFLVDVGSP